MALETASSIDLHIGKQIQLARVMARLEVSALAEAAKIESGQLLAFEAGARVNAAYLFAIARTLDKPISYFYDGMNAHLASADQNSSF